MPVAPFCAVKRKYLLKFYHTDICLSIVVMPAVKDFQCCESLIENGRSFGYNKHTLPLKVIFLFPVA